MARIFQRSGKWYLDTRDVSGRRRRQVTTATTKRDALLRLAELENKLERQRLGLEARPSDNGMTFAQLAGWWLKHRCPPGSVDRETIRLRCHVVDAQIGQLPLRAVTPAALEALFHEKGRKGLSAGSINKLRAIIRTIFSRATKEGLWIGQNPAALTEHRRVPRRIYETVTAEELPVLLAQLSAEDRGFFAAAAYAGLRRGECAGLRKADVDLERATLTIRASYDSDTTKGGHADVIPIPEPLLPYLTAALGTPGPYLFPWPNGRMRPPGYAAGRVLRGALGRAGLVLGYDHRCRSCKHQGKPHVERHANKVPRACPRCRQKLWPKALPRPLRFHDLRHSCATILLRAGVDIHRVQRILRHASVTTTASTYAHLAVDDLREGFAAAYGPPMADSKPLPAALTGSDGPNQAHAALETTSTADDPSPRSRIPVGILGGRSRDRTCDQRLVRALLYR
jgi:integrase